MDNQKFGKFIKELRKKSNMTQKELGEKLNVTDKAVSKWERGLSFPDITIINSLAETFGITSSEILNAELGKKEEIDIEKAIQEAVENIMKEKEKRQEKRKKIQKIITIISTVVFVICFIIQLGYITILRKHGYEYVSDIVYYIINEIIVITAIIPSIYITQYSKIKNKLISNIIVTCVAIILTTTNFAFMLNNGFKNKCIVSFSSDFSNELVLKQNKETGETILYKNAKLFIFAKPKEKFSYAVEGKIKHQWLVNDVCSITYKDKDGKLREFVATYGDRSNGISYYYVTTAISGDWQTRSQYGTQIEMSMDSKGIKIKKDKKSEEFEYDKIKQYGTLATVLYKNETPKYVIALNKDCKIDEKTEIIKRDGTITLTEVSMEKTVKEKLYCTTYKNANDLTNYLFFLDNTLENISKTRNRKLASMKRLYEYLETNNLINVNPTKWMQSATIEKRQPKYLDLNESKQLLANAINSDCRYKIRNYAITCLFLNCSLRLSELVGINLSDLKIDNSEQTLKVTGKGQLKRKKRLLIIYLTVSAHKQMTLTMPE